MLYAQAYSETRQTPKTERFATIFIGDQFSTILQQAPSQMSGRTPNTHLGMRTSLRNY